MPRTNYAAENAAYPSKITLFSGPCSCARHVLEELAERVTETVYHEIAHHFGISDARLHELQRAAVTRSSASAACTVGFGHG